MLALTKGQNIGLDSLNYTEQTLFIGFDWQVKQQNDFDIDASALLLGTNEQVRSHQDFIFYNQPEDFNGCLNLITVPQHEGIKRGFYLKLALIPDDIEKILFILTIDQADKRQQNFSQVESILLGLYDNDKSDERLVDYQVQVENHETALMVGMLYRHQGKWKFKTIGQGFCEGLDAIAYKYQVDLTSLSQEVYSEDPAEHVFARKRRSPNQVLQSHTQSLFQEFESIMPKIHEAVTNKINESNTRMILDRIFMEIMGYELDELKAEQAIQGRRADYVLAIDDIDTLVIEVKKAGMRLSEKQIFQATSYGAYSGIRWALLTNLVEWQVYHISTGDKVEGNLVFSVNFSDGITQQDAALLVLISRYGLGRKNLIEKLRLETNALSENSIKSALLTEDVISKIRLTIKRDKGVVVTNEQVQQSLEDLLNVS